MDYLARNLEALSKTHPEIAARIEGKNLRTSGIEIKTSHSGDPYIYLTQHGNMECAFDPKIEAAKYMQYEAEPGEMAVLKGFGLGYVADEMLKMNYKKIFVAEPCLAIMVLMMKHRDMTKFFLDERVIISVGDPVGTVSVLADIANVSTRTDQRMYLSKPITVVTHPITTMFADWNGMFDSMMMELMLQIERNKVTFEMLHKRWRNNLISNLPVLKSSTPLKSLKGLYNGHTGVLVGAGPSLDKNIDALRASQDFGLVVAVDTAYPILQESGITPDFVISMDSLPSNARYFQDVQINHSKTSLVMLPYVDKTIPDRFKFRFIASNGHPFQKWIEDQTGYEFGLIQVSGGVSTLAYEFMKFIGLDNIIFCGCDMAVSDKFHATGWKSYEGSNKFESVEDQEYGEIEDASIEVDAWGGGKVMTTPKMSYWIDWFQKQIKRDEVNVINATEGGARVQGFDEMTLKQALKLHGKPSGITWRDMMNGVRKPMFPASKLEASLSCISDHFSDILKWETVVFDDSKLANIRADLTKQVAQCSL